MKDHFSPSRDDESSNNISIGMEDDFQRVVRVFVGTFLDSETPRDVQYSYLAPGGDHKILKDLLTVPREHACRFKEMLHITELLPPGETPPPSNKLVVQRYNMTYHRADRHEYVNLGKKLSDNMIEMLAAYFQLLCAQLKSDSMLERAKVDLLKNRAQKMLAKSLREQH